MAVQPWELEPDLCPAPPRLELVPEPPRSGRVIPALVLVTLIFGVLAWPAARASREPQVAVAYALPRPLPASQIARLDPVRPLAATRPRSSEPLGGILFVSCTNLWTALPDGSQARKLVAFPGASSPAFSPDARTIAFVGPSDAGPALFMVAADGSRLTKLGDLDSDGFPISARVSNLSWSPRADKLAFALVDPAFDAWSEGSTIWSLDLATGEFRRLGHGSPSPAFVDRGVAWSSNAGARADTHGRQFTTSSPSARYTAKNMSTDSDDVTFATMPGTFSDAWATDHGVVVMRATDDGGLELVTKSDVWSRKVEEVHTAPSPHSFLRTGRVSVAQDGSHAVVDLVDPKGDRSMGLLDLVSGEWTVRAYSWSGIATPVPTAVGPVGAARAERLARDFFGSRRRSGDTYRAAALLVGDREKGLLGGGRGGSILGTPYRSAKGWSVPATVYARRDGRYKFQHALFEMSTTADGRIEGSARAVSPTYPLVTIADARRFLSETVSDGFVWPTYLPAGVELDPEWPVEAYSYGDVTTATIRMRLPRQAGERHPGTLAISYGDVHFGLGCGGEVNPEETSVGDQQALFDQTGAGPRHARQVLWPGTLDARDVGKYSVYGQLPRSEIEAIAASMTGG